MGQHKVMEDEVSSIGMLHPLQMFYGNLFWISS